MPITNRPGARRLAKLEIQERLIADDVFDQDIDGYAASAAAAELIYGWHSTPEMTDDDRYNDIGGVISQLQRFRQSLDDIDLMALETSRPTAAKPEPEPAVRQTVCRYCGLDIERLTATEPAVWRDRGGETSCRGGGEHDPV